MNNEKEGEFVQKRRGKSIKLLLFLGIIFLVVLASESVSASWVNDFFRLLFGVNNGIDVKMISNTDFCLIDCETVYEIKSNDKQVQFSFGKNLSFKFRDKKNSMLKNNVNGLLSYEVYYNETVLTNKYCDNATSYSCNGYNTINNTVIPRTCYNNTPYFCGTNSRENFVKLKNNQVLTLNVGESKKLKIVGHKKPFESIDNVLSLDYENTKKDFTEWAWWNTDCNNKRKIEIVNNITRLENSTVFLELNSSNYPFGTNDKNFRILNATEDGVIQHYNPYYSSTDKEAFVYWNTNNQSFNIGQNLTYYLYYSCTGLTDSNNQSGMSQSNLSIYYTFDEPDISSLGQVNDSSNRLYHGKYFNDYQNVDGVFGNASNLTNLQMNVSQGVSPFTLVNSGNSFGVSFWFKLTKNGTPSQTVQLLEYNSLNSAANGFSIYLPPTPPATQHLGSITFSMNSENCLAQINKTINDSEFHHVYVYRNSSIFNFSVDELSVQTTKTACISYIIDDTGSPRIPMILGNSTIGIGKAEFDDFRFWKGSPGWNTHKLRNLSVVISSEEVNNQRPHIDLILSNNTNMYITTLQNFTWNVKDDVNTTLNCNLIINSTINLTINGISNNSNVTRFVNFTYVRVNDTWAVNCTDGSLTNQSETRFFSVTNAPVTFNQSMQNVRVLGNGGVFFRQVNCSAASGNAITYSNNQTQLFNITSSGGVINDTPINSEANNYTVVIKCDDGTADATSNFTYEITGLPGQLTFLYNVSNTTVYETSNQSFYINFTYNTSGFNVSGVVLMYNGTVYQMTFLNTTNDTSSSHSNYNVSTYKNSVIIPIVYTNNTAQNYNISVNLTGINNVNNTFVYNDSQTRLYAYSILQINRLQNYTEGATSIPINFTIGNQTGLASVNGVIEFNRTNQTGTRTVDSNVLTYSSTFSIGYADSLNQVLPIIVYANFSYNNISRISTLSGTNITISQTGITNCSSGGGITDRTLNFTIRDEVTNNILAQASFEGTFQAYKTTSYYRNFSVVSSLNGSFEVCYRPVFDNITVNIEAEYSNTSYNTRFYFNKIFKISNLTQAITLYLLSNSTTTNLVKITVNDQNDEALEGRTVQIHKLDFATNNLTIVEQQNTNFNGETGFTIATSNTYYVVKIFNGQTQELQTIPFLMFSPFTYVYRVSVGEQKVLSNNLQLLLIPKTFVFNNVTKNVTFNYTDNTNFLGNVCLNVQNGSISNVTLYSNCVDSASGWLSYSVGQNKSKFFAYVTAVVNNDGLNYYWDTLDFDTSGEGLSLGAEGLILSFFIIGVMAFAGLFNPSAAILFAMLALLITIIINFNALPIALGIGGIVAGVLVIYVLKT